MCAIEVSGAAAGLRHDAMFHCLILDELDGDLKAEPRPRTGASSVTSASPGAEAGRRRAARGRIGESAERRGLRLDAGDVIAAGERMHDTLAICSPCRAMPDKRWRLKCRLTWAG